MLTPALGIPRLQGSARVFLCASWEGPLFLSPLLVGFEGNCCTFLLLCNPVILGLQAWILICKIEVDSLRFCWKLLLTVSVVR